jgi:hypothetical protein
MHQVVSGNLRGVALIVTLAEACRSIAQQSGEGAGN